MRTPASRLMALNQGRKMGKPQTKLTKAEAKALGEAGLFGYHLADLLEAAGLSHQAFAEQCKKRGLAVEEHAVRTWLRGESMPKANMLRDLGKVLKLDDPRHILPE